MAHINYLKGGKMEIFSQSNLYLIDKMFIAATVSELSGDWKHLQSDHDVSTSLSSGPFAHMGWKIQTGLYGIPATEPTSI